MNPAVLIFAELLLKYGPDVAQAIQSLFKKSDPTDEDFQRIIELANKNYDSYKEAAKRRAGV